MRFPALAARSTQSDSGMWRLACRGVGGNGTYFAYMTPAVVAWRFLTAKKRKGRWVPEEGVSTIAGGYERLEAE